MPPLRVEKVPFACPPFRIAEMLLEEFRVVLFSSCPIVQHGVSSVQPLRLALRVIRTPKEYVVPVLQPFRVQLLKKLPVGVFYLILIGTLRDAKDFVPTGAAAFWTRLTILR